MSDVRTGFEPLAHRVAMFLAFVAATLAVMASLHISGVLTGEEPFRGGRAGVSEAVIGVVLVVGAVALFRAGGRARPIAMASTAFAIIGFIVGLSFTIRGGGTIDIAYHVATLPVLLYCFGALARAGSTGAPERLAPPTAHPNQP
jgi:hypothetical protein